MGIGENTGQHIGEHTGSYGLSLLPPVIPPDNDDPIDWQTLKTNATGTTTLVSTKTEFNNASSSASPGDVIIVANGTYNWSGLDIPSVGTEQDPIIYTAQNVGGVVLQNIVNLFSLTGDYNIIGGFTFNDITDQTFYITGALNNRITDNTFNRVGPVDGGARGWIDVTRQSNNNRFDHNIVDASTAPIRLLLDNNAVANGVSSGLRIDHNTFQNQPNVASDYPPIQISQGDPSASGSSLLNTGCIIERNLFINCSNGSNATIEIKTSYVTVRYNELDNCNGSLYQRQGDHNDWYGNYCHGLAAGYGIEIGGSYHKIYNNVFDLTDSIGLVLFRPNSTPNGQPNHDILIAHNTWLGYSDLPGSWSVSRCLLVGYADPSKGAVGHIYNIDIVNNIMIGDDGHAVTYHEGDYDDHVFTNPNDVTFNNNLYYLTGTAAQWLYDGTDANEVLGNPNLSDYSPTVNSTLVIDNATALAGNPVTVDFTGAARPGGTNNDIGAIEYGA